jgi:hypothetical protein
MASMARCVATRASACAGRSRTDGGPGFLGHLGRGGAAPSSKQGGTCHLELHHSPPMGEAGESPMQMEV